ncbi:MAG: hypothetical protein ACT4OX_01530 [Actinomycetota bacterium]
MTPWGVGCYDDGAQRVAWELSDEEIQRDMAGATATLQRLGVDAGQRVLFCSMLSEAAHFWPLIVATMLNGAQLSCADANEGDAARVDMFTRMLEYRAVLGVTDAILDGLDARARPYEEVFGAVPVVGARPGAYARLRARGLAPHRLVLCGPVLAVGTDAGGPAFAAGDEWELATDGDRIVVTNLKPRATTFSRAPTAIRGTIVDGGVVPVDAGEQR